MCVIPAICFTTRDWWDWGLSFFEPMLLALILFVGFSLDPRVSAEARCALDAFLPVIGCKESEAESSFSMLVLRMTRIS